MGSESYHESADDLSEPTRDLHRALTSLCEELEAVDWYQQRAEACSDQQLRAVLEHNRDEEIEHAMMIVEWLRRTRPSFAERIATYLNTTADITEIEEQETSGGDGIAAGTGGTLGIGSLKAVR